MEGFFFHMYFNIYSCLAFVCVNFEEKIDCFVFVVSQFWINISLSLSFIRLYSFFFLSTSSYRAEIVKQRSEGERACVKKFFELTLLSLKEELLLGRANIHLACSLFSLSLLLLLLSQLLMHAVCNPLSPLSSLSRIQWNHKKRVKETKITIHHRTKKKNKGFLTNNNDRYVTNMNSFFSLSLASFCSYLYSIISAFWREEE